MINKNDIQKVEFPLDFNEIVTSFEENLIRQAMEQSNGIACRAAKLLNLKRTTFIEKLRKMKGISYKKKKSPRVPSALEASPAPIWRANTL